MDGMPYVPARVAEFSGILRSVPKDFRLAPRMTVVAEIEVGERSVISYFAYPFIKAVDEGMREPLV
jgi:hemolysin D